MLGYYSGRFLQILGLVITGETLIMHFGEMAPLLKGSLLGVIVFYLGSFLVRRYGTKGL
jgi:hypothetical protein